MLRDREKLIYLALAGGFLFLFLDIRFEHRDEVLTEPKAWIPIYYGAAASLFSLLAVWFAGRLKWLLVAVFAIGLIVAGLGVFFHVDGEWNGLMEIVKASKDFESSGPPLVAPLGIAGLAVVGLIQCLVPARPVASD